MVLSLFFFHSVVFSQSYLCVSVVSGMLHKIKVPLFFFTFWYLEAPKIDPHENNTLTNVPPVKHDFQYNKNDKFFPC